MSKVKVTISELGDPVIEAIGFQGTGCKAATLPFEQAFAGGEASVTEKPEMFEHAESPRETVTA